MLCTATYYETLCLDTEHWYCMHDCVIIATDKQIRDIVSYTTYKKQYSSLPITEKQGFHIPAFVNAHTHIDNAYLFGKTTTEQGFYSWLCSVLQERKEDSYIQKYLESNTNSLLIQDTAFIATIASSPWLQTLLTQQEIPHYVFYESIGGYPLTPEFNTSPPFYNMSYAGHALYSTEPSVLRQIKALCNQYNVPFSIHLAEHEEEHLFLQGVPSDFSTLLQKRLRPNYNPPYKSPVAYAYELGLLDNNTLAIHCVHCSKEDIELLQKSHVYVCLCPRSNTYIGVGTADARTLYESDIPLCIATDGLASNTSLSMWEEAVYAMNIYGFTLKECIPMMTIQPARALGIDSIFGKLQINSYPMTTEIPQEYLG